MHITITPEERYTLAALRTQLPRLSTQRSRGAWADTRARSVVSWSATRLTTTARTGPARRGTDQRQPFTDTPLEQVDGKAVDARRGSARPRSEPDQISGRLRREGTLQISHEAIYQYVWGDKRAGGHLYLSLRQRTRRRKRYATQERRGQLAGKRHISERPTAANERRQIGHWEIDTVHGSGRHSVVTIVERKTGLVLIGKLPNLSALALNERVLQMIRGFEHKHGPSFRTITADNGTEFHSYDQIERKVHLRFYFATPYHSWERGTSENTNGLIRQYLPKRMSFASLSQAQCNAIARRLNERPRERHAYATPLERFYAQRTPPRL